MVEQLRGGSAASLEAATAGLTAALAAARELAPPPAVSALPPAEVLATLTGLVRAAALPSPARCEALGLTPVLVADALPLGFLAQQIAWLGAFLGREDPQTENTDDHSVTPRSGKRIAAPRRLAGADLDLLWQRGLSGAAAVLQDPATRETAPHLADLLARHAGLLDAANVDRAWAALFADQAGRVFLQSNCYESVWYFSRERGEALVRHALLAASRRPDAQACGATAARLFATAAAAGYREKPFLSAIVVPPSTARAAALAPEAPTGDETGGAS